MDMFDDDNRPVRRSGDDVTAREGKAAGAGRDPLLDDDAGEADRLAHQGNVHRGKTRSAGNRSWRLIRWLVLVFLFLVVVYYPAGMLITHRVSDDLGFQPPGDLNPEGGSQAVAVTTALIDREVNHNGWIPNDPWFLPSAALDNMPNFQLGLKQALFRVAIELADQIGRTRGSSQVDPDLEEAAGELKFPGDVWLWNPTISLLPTASSEAHYRVAIDRLARYNTRLAAGNAVFDRRADNLLATIDRIALDLGSASAEIDDHIARNSGWFDLKADDVFFNVKGRLYGYAIVLDGLGTDFKQVITERQLDAVWHEMLQSMRTAAALDPLLIINGAPDGMSPSHLTTQGFYLLRARTQLREISNILLK